MKQIDIEELQWFITSILERDEYIRIYSENELDNPEHIKGDDYVIGVAVGVSRAKKALEKYLSIDHTSIIDSILKEAGIKEPYMDGDQFCILLGSDLQSGICGFGKSKKEALIDFLQAVRLCFNKSIETSHWKSNEQQKPNLEKEIENYTEALYHETFGNGQGTLDEFDWEDIVQVIDDTARYFYNLDKNNA